MKRYDDIVVGSGISGLTMALILGMNGRKVLLLEKNPFIGGSISRFYKNGIPFDTGFHFTGGLQKGGILYDILTVLEVRDLIRPIFLSQDRANCFFIESEGRQYEVPYGIDNIKNKFKEYFPEETSAIDRYFGMVQKVCDDTPSMNLRTIFSEHILADEDFITLEEVLNKLTQNHALKALLSALAMCYGVKPEEISFANHSRMCLELYHSVARIENGGSALVQAFKKKFKDHDIEIRCSTHITEFADINNKKVGSFILNTGEEVSGDNCVFTIHPREILKILPREYISRAFIDRISDFESSVGFFSVFTVLDSDHEEPDFESSILSIFPHCDVNRLLDPAYKGAPALVLIKSVEHVRDKTYKTIDAFEISFPEHVKEWEVSKTGERPRAYQEYKKGRVDDIMGRIIKVYPQYKDKLQVVDSASVLTFRDYLNSPDGSAYGIKQKMNQINLIGKLPLRNLYAAGQSSLLPGIIGAMMSSFIVGRTILDENKYREFIFRNLST
ncbi:MAG: NAD(P)/FAD-dependent oxidoreductase [Nitrospiraceae bacterium]|nr:MAG: NAD(P)/FAD-dependent oxidoreductase [Nitrospiraceae bacterium]